MINEKNLIHALINTPAIESDDILTIVAVVKDLHEDGGLVDPRPFAATFVGCGCDADPGRIIASLEVQIPNERMRIVRDLVELAIVDGWSFEAFREAMGKVLEAVATKPGDS